MDALPQLVTPAAIKLLDRFKILNEREVHARYEIFLENYNKTINIEGQLMVLMANRYILPAAFEYQKQIGQSVAAVKAGGGKSAQGKKLLVAYTKLADKLKIETDALADAARARRRVGREARQVHARQGRAGDGQAARDGRQHRSAHAAFALAAADVSGDALREVGAGAGAGRRTRDGNGCDGPASVPARCV